MQTEEQRRKAKRQAEAKYRNRVYDRLAIRVKKGRRDIYKQLADIRGESLAGMITALLDAAALEAGLLDAADVAEEQDAAPEDFDTSSSSDVDMDADMPE